jgi:hypothetical protein
LNPWVTAAMWMAHGNHLISGAGAGAGLPRNELKYFWSFTMYKLPQRWLVANPIDPGLELLTRPYCRICVVG